MGTTAEDSITVVSEIDTIQQGWIFDTSSHAFAGGPIDFRCAPSGKGKCQIFADANQVIRESDDGAAHSAVVVTIVPDTTDASIVHIHVSMGISFDPKGGAKITLKAPYLEAEFPDNPAGTKSEKDADWTFQCECNK